MTRIYTIGNLSEKSGVNIETIRYYERINLLPKPTRSASGYRLYSEEAVVRLRFIRRGRELGFGIEEIRALLWLADHPNDSCEEADRLVDLHLDEIESKIKDLQAMRAELKRLSGCQGRTAAHCRLIETLSDLHRS